VKPVIALLTDFGTRDHYVGAMRGVALGICPDASLVDITHHIEPQDILGGALELAAAFRYFPHGTVFLCVVDPGVGSARGVLVVEAGGHAFLAPDNGLLAQVIEQADSAVVRQLAPAASTELRLSTPSATFHGRDVFAPIAAEVKQITSGASATSLSVKSRPRRRGIFIVSK